MKDTGARDLENSGEKITLELAFAYKVCAKSIRKFLRFRIEVQQFIANEGSLAQMGIELLVVFFRNKEIFVQLDELDEENHPCMNRIQLQPHTSTANFLM